MALKKSELYSSLWSSCDELRGGEYIENIRVARKYAYSQYALGVDLCFRHLLSNTYAIGVTFPVNPVGAKPGRSGVFVNELLKGVGLISHSETNGVPRQ
jgi:hypothetical protein